LKLRTNTDVDWCGNVRNLPGFVLGKTTDFRSGSPRSGVTLPEGEGMTDQENLPPKAE
jgi:hypothetical protein